MIRTWEFFWRTICYNESSVESNAYREAVLKNDDAHRKSIVQVANSGDTQERQEIFKDIHREAIMWLRHLDSIHGRR